MKYIELQWDGPHLLSSLDFALVPSRPGVYVFTECSGPLRPNPLLPGESDPRHAAALESMRRTACVLYVGRASNLQSRLRGYRFRPYLEINRRPKGTPPRHVADRHKGRALLHAHQYFDGILYVRWAVDNWPKLTEPQLIRELRPALNTLGLPAGQ